jgi:DNA-directed RNA polymerase beta subunit
MILDGKDLPFSADGMVPDIIFSPNGLIKRMTVNYMLEVLGGKTGAMGGRYIDGSTFASEDAESLQKQLLKLGFREDGSEALYDGRTGKQYTARIFVGSLYYLRLYHQVRDKIQSRARGPIQLLTHQPTEGKAKEGGTRFGEMEKETLVGHGASLLLKERFDSDKTIMYICSKCGDLAMFDFYKNKPICEACAGKSKAYPVEISYAFKLFLDELKSLYIRPLLILEDKY